MVRTVEGAVPWGLVGVMAGTAVLSHGLRPLAGYRAVEMGASAFEIGLLASAFAFGALVLALPGGRLIDRIGPGPVIILACVLLPASVTAAALAVSLPVLIVSASAFGIGQILAVVALQSAVARDRTPSQLDSVFGWLTAGTSVGQVLGPLLALALPGLVSTGATATGLLILLGVSAAVGSGGVIVGVRLRTAVPHVREARGRGSARILRIPGMPVAFVASGVVLACLDLLAVFLPLWAAENGVSRSAAGVLLATRGAVSLVSRLGLAALARRISRRTLIVGSTGAGAGAFALLPALDFWGATVAMVVIGFGFGLVQPLTLTWVASVVAPASRGAALGLRMMSNRLVQVVLPLGIGVLSTPLAFLGSSSSRSLILSAVALGVSAVASASASWDIDGPDDHEPPTDDTVQNI
ncbi:MFS transporter [Microbacterium sp. zg.Y625]|uniref:MFS transporter n=1 Tax=Microbacterium jiangjiandongii TaxID=3049071 RepID=UPI00214B893C|nr:MULTISPECIES: MFS transporter [unclassified Microbacterium]MCR2793277.1 MFS transporter [Microbacterium sp. zg.Y625]WIM25346.1 MFS transporter [Microbacterium sp. zg-Y625]